MIPHNPTILALDTSGPHIAAALLWRNAIHGAAHIEMRKGQAENLIGVLDACLAKKELSYEDLDMVAVGIGPGNFTGIRISVSTARALALALGKPAIGVSAFEIMRDPTGFGAHPAEIVSVPAPRDQAYVQHFQYGIPQSEPHLIDPKHPHEDLRLPVNMRIRGHRAEEISQAFNCEHSEADLEDIGPRVARIAEWRVTSQTTTTDRPAPLYVRPADATPPSDPPPKILDA